MKTESATVTVKLDMRQPDSWQSTRPGMGSCFHQAMDRWSLLRCAGEYDYRIGIGVVSPSAWDLQRHLHAWLESLSTRYVISAVTGNVYDRQAFYLQFGVEPHSIRLVNPRGICRAARNRAWTCADILLLLDLSGVPYRIVNGGVLPK